MDRPTWQQIELMQAVERPGCRVSTKSGHGTGKSRVLGVTALWHLLCYFQSNFIITAPKIEQVRTVAWKEIADISERIKAGPYSWIGPYLIVEAEKVYVRGYKMQWYVIAKTAPRGSPENLAGQHRDHLMWWADEASGIDDAAFGVVTGSLTDARNRMAMTSQPTRTSGYFYDSHHSGSIRVGGVWKDLTLNSEQSPLVSDKWLAEKLSEYGGRDDPQYMIKVRGEFPDNLAEFLIGRNSIETRVGFNPILPGQLWGRIITVDVAAGEYRDKSVVVNNKVYGWGDFGDDARRVYVEDIPLHSNSRNLDELSGFTFRYVTEQYPDATVMVDAGGMGIAVCQRLETMGMSNIVRVKWGNPCFKKSYTERYFNQRAMAMHQLSKAAKEGRWGCAPNLTSQREMLDQGSRIPYSFDEKARYVIAKKEKMRSDGLPSPDVWDTMSFPFLEDANYIAQEAGGDTENWVDRQKNDARERLRKEMEEAEKESA